MNYALRRGFTIVELLIVIVVIVILAALVSVMYVSVQSQANDTKLYDAAVKVGDSLQLFYAKNGHFPVGGSGSSAALSGAECASGADGFISTGVYQCTLEDVLVANQYLPSGYSAGLPQNTLYAPTSANYSIYVRYTGVDAGKILVMYTMEDPSSDDTTRFQSEVTKCGLTWAAISTERTTYNMQNAVCAQP